MKINLLFMPSSKIELQRIVKTRMFETQLALPEKCRVYWINLESSIDRRERMQKRLEEVQWTDSVAKRINATSVDVVDDYILDDHWATHGSRYNKRAAACTVSHLRAIETAYKDGCEMAIILEDDVTFEFCEHWKHSLVDLIATAPNDFNLLLLSWFCVSPSVLKRLENNRLAGNGWMQHQKGIYGSFAYVISRKYMKQLLDERCSNGKFSIFTKSGHRNCNADWIITEAKNNIYASTIPLFAYEAIDSEIHSTSVVAQRRHLEWMREII